MSSESLPSQLFPLEPLTGEVRAIIVEDHPVYAFGLHSLLGSMPNVKVCQTFCDGPSAIAGLRDRKADLVILDIGLPGLDGFETLTRMLKECPGVRVLIVSVHSKIPFALKALRLGARGYAQKEQHLSDIVSAVKQVIDGGVYINPDLQGGLVFDAIYRRDSSAGIALDSLSPRELDVLRLMGNGYSTKDIADAFGLSVKTIETHRVHIKEKLGTQSGDDLSRFAKDWVTAQRE